MGFEIVGYKWTIGRDFWLVGHWVWQNTVESNHSGLSMIWASKVLMTYTQEQVCSVRSYSIILCSLITQFAYTLLIIIISCVMLCPLFWATELSEIPITGLMSALSDTQLVGCILESTVQAMTSWYPYYTIYYMYMVIYRLYMKSATPLWLDFDRV